MCGVDIFAWRPLSLAGFGGRPPLLLDFGLGVAFLPGGLRLSHFSIIRPSGSRAAFCHDKWMLDMVVNHFSFFRIAALSRLTFVNIACCCGESRSPLKAKLSQNWAELSWAVFKPTWPISKDRPQLGTGDLINNTHAYHHCPCRKVSRCKSPSVSYVQNNK